MRIYMDNSATSFPKPPEVIEAMAGYMAHCGSSVSRSTSSEASETGDKLFQLREDIADFFHADNSRNVIFTKNITEALNIIINGYISKGDLVMVSSLEHNAIIRPLRQVQAHLIEIPLSSNGSLDLSFAKTHIPSVKAVFCTHVSNVSGDVLPIEALAELCHQYKKPFILDTAQSAGFLPIDMQQTPIDCLCFTGHKSLLGPTGTGGMILHTKFAEQIPPFITGGTGSKSDEEDHPLMMPDKFEAGTPNVCGLIGLLASINYLRKKGISTLFQQETKLGQKFFEKLSSLDGIDIIGSKDYSCKPPVFSLNFHHKDNAEISYLLSERYHIDNRCGLHCSPRAHRSYGTFPFGTVRLSLSHFTTEAEIDTAFQAIRELR